LTVGGGRGLGFDDWDFELMVSGFWILGFGLWVEDLGVLRQHLYPLVRIVTEDRAWHVTPRVQGLRV